VRVGCSRFLWAVMTILLIASPTIRADVTVPANETWDIDYDVHGTDPTGTLMVNGTANVLPGAVVTDALLVGATGTANIYGGDIGPYINVDPYAVDTPLTVYGTDFTIGGTPKDYGVQPLYGIGLLAGKYGDGSAFSIWIYADSVNLQPPAPEDPADLILQLIDKVELLNHYQGIVNSLDAKLDAALKALSDLNENNDGAAINTLNAFINAVEAQRDDKITSEQADELIGDAQAIIDLLST